MPRSNASTFRSESLKTPLALLAIISMVMTLFITMAPQAAAADGSFWDDDGSTHEADIEAIAAAGITKGCGSGKFCPDDPVTRGQMAAFLHRALGGKISAAKSASFSDISSSIFAADIRWLSAAGLTAGCDTNRFCPNAIVTREQMAAFLHRGLEDIVNSGSAANFTDTSSSKFRDDIAWLSGAGITQGCGGGKFCPQDEVTREQMASFLTRALRLEPIKPRPNTTNGVRIAPGQSIQNMVNSRPNGTVFVLETGRHRNQKVVPKNGNVFVGEPGAIMDGGNQTDAAFSNGGSNVTIQGLIIENYATPAQRGAIEAAGAGWKIFDNEIRNNAGAGLSLGGDGFVVDGNYIHHNQQIGIIGQGAAGARVVNNEISHNNQNDRYDHGWESGGAKFLRTTNLHIANNNVRSNHGPGLWADYNNYNTTYENNTVRDNYGPGILHEVSYDAVIRNNTVTGNALQFYVGGILVASSSNVEVYGNNLSGNHGGIIGLQDSRGSGNRGTFQTTGLNVHDNNVSWTNGYHGIQVNSGPDITNSNTITFSGNDYTANGTLPFKWGSSNSNLTWQQWQSLGHDTTGTFN